MGNDHNFQDQRSSSKPAIFTSPDNHIVFCIRLNIALKYIKMFGWSISFFYVTGIFTKTSISNFLK